MTTADYPMPTIPNYELYQLAHVATFIADWLARHREARTHRDTTLARHYARDVHLGRHTLATLTGDTGGATAELPRPLDTATHRLAERMLTEQTQRRAEVVSLAGAGRPTWATIGYVPGIGPVGAETTSHDTALAIREHLLTEPAHRLSPWRITAEPLTLHRAAVRDRDTLLTDAATTILALNPADPQHIALARNLHGHTPVLDAVIRDRFGPFDPHTPVPRTLPTDPHPTQQTTGQVNHTSTSPGQHPAAQPAAPTTSAAARADVALTPTPTSSAPAAPRNPAPDSPRTSPHSRGAPARRARSRTRLPPGRRMGRPAPSRRSRDDSPVPPARRGPPQRRVP